MSYISQISQKVVADANNSSTTNLAAGNSYTFTGTSTSTLGVAGIQVSLYANKNCIIKVQQSPDGTNWDLIDPFYYTALANFGVTVQAISSYVRVVVTTMSETTTTFRLQTALCPIVEAVPRTLDSLGNLRISTPVDAFGFKSDVSPHGELSTVQKIRLVGAQFEGATIDGNFWATSVSTGTVAQSGSNITITSGTANGHYARLYSVRRARFVSGSVNKFRCHLRLADTGTVNVKRRWGIVYGASMPTITDGAYFELDGTTFSVVTYKNSGETRVSSGSFNGQYGYTYAPTTSDTVWEILYTSGTVYFIVNGTILHTVQASTATWADTLHQYVWMDVSNSGASAAVAMYSRAASISRIGSLGTAPTSFYQAGTVAAQILKYGPGSVKGVCISGVTSNAAVTLYDNTAASGRIIFSTGAMGATAQPFSLSLLDAPFWTGLTLTIATSNCNCTVIYE